MLRRFRAFGLFAGMLVVLALLGHGLAHLTSYLSRAAAIAEAHGADERAREAREPVGTHGLEEWPAERGRDFGEAPTLKQRVEAGELPPVSQRLPEDPLVIVPPQQEGPYGGQWQRLATGPADVMGTMRSRLQYDGFLRWDAQGHQIVPNLARDWNIEDGGRTFTLYLRRGVRWSDGEPFTVDDIVFWYEHILQNEELMPVVPSELKRDGELFELEKLDDYTVQFRFAEPHGLFLRYLASGTTSILDDIFLSPRHYLEQFHPAFADEDELRRRTHERGYQFWYQLFDNRAGTRNPDLPRLSAWVLEQELPAQPVAFRRNPYYWKVDPSGNQLPYIEQVSFTILDPEMINLRVRSGEIGMQHRHLLFADYPLFMRHQRDGGYRVLEWPMGAGHPDVLWVNQSNKRDSALREITGDARFRKALSYGIDREEINEAAYFGVGEPRQVTPTEDSPFHLPGHAQAYTEYAPSEARRLLDEMGLDEKNSRGIRLQPDGRPLRLNIETVDMLENATQLTLLADHWRRIGIDARVRIQARPLWQIRLQASLHDITAWWGGGDENHPLLFPRNSLFPNNTNSYQGPEHGRWFASGGESGDEPPAPMREAMELFRQIERTVDEQKQAELTRRILQINKENLWVIGIVGRIPALVVVNERFRNVPDEASYGWILKTPGNTAPECYAIAPE